MRINRTSNRTIPLPYRYDVGTLGNESVFAKTTQEVTQESYG